MGGVVGVVAGVGSMSKHTLSLVGGQISAALEEQHKLRSTSPPRDPQRSSAEANVSAGAGWGSARVGEWGAG